MKNGITYNVLIADSDVLFRTRLKNVMKELVSKAIGSPIRIYEAKNMAEMKRAFVKKIYLAFIDYLFILNDRTELEEILRENSEVRQVVLISHKGGLKIREVINQFKKRKYLKIENYILKDNYSVDFLLELIRVFLEPIIKRK